MTRLGNIDQQFKPQKRTKYPEKKIIECNSDGCQIKDGFLTKPKPSNILDNMCVCCSQLMMLPHTGQISKIPHLFSLENTMKLCPMIVQALWDQKNPLLQVPHIDEDILKYVNSKYHIKTLEQCVRLNQGDKRKSLRNLTKKQYCNVCKVLGNMPLVNTQINVEVKYAEETNVITVGSLVTASVFLSKKSFSSLMNVEGNSIITIVLLNEPKVMKEEVKEIEDDIRNLDASISQDEDSENKEGAKDDEDWDKFRNPFSKRQKVLERKSRSSHSAHCQYFSEDMQEFWWVYLTDKKIETILTAPFQVTNLVDKEEIMMAFTAPVTPGLNKFTLCVRADSYLGLDQFKSFTLDVKRAPEQPKIIPNMIFPRTKKKEGSA
ncbi:hypothetical protein QYM36_012987 [Artemia franciscana]|uniref:SEC63 domain-containing protein n=1 Tax=Artemia franciscana TaxID=6661 RepID=A0AA88HP15_ARTSF|nr:hypothetical protein QYM36_012987 [Artemia franciscana]